MNLHLQPIKYWRDEYKCKTNYALARRIYVNESSLDDLERRGVYISVNGIRGEVPVVSVVKIIKSTHEQKD